MEHYYTKKPTSQIREHSFESTLHDNRLTFTTATGLFSLDHVDYGTFVLISYADVIDGNSILDLGCGYGPVGISFAKAYDITVTFSDVNERAVKYAKRNAKDNKLDLDKMTFVHSTGFEKIDGKFDVILLNPPQSAGKKVCEELIKNAKDYLVDGGSLQLIARKNKGGASLSTFMQEVYGNVDVIKKKGGFWLYRSFRR